MHHREMKPPQVAPSIRRKLGSARAPRVSPSSCARLLADDRVDFDMVAAGGVTPLLAACKANHMDVLELLLDHEGVDVNRPGPRLGGRGSSGLCAPTCMHCRRLVGTN